MKELSKGIDECDVSVSFAHIVDSMRIFATDAPILSANVDDSLKVIVSGV